MKSIYFYRNFSGFSGGNLKHWHYFQHVSFSRSFSPYIYFTKATVWDQSNPWDRNKNQVLDSWDFWKADALFLAGLDWNSLGAHHQQLKVPVINLIQGIRHADKDDQRFDFLQRRAIRICVSTEVAAAIQNTGRVNGPIFTIPNCIDPTAFPHPKQIDEKKIDILLVPKSHRDLALNLYSSLQTRNLVVEILPSTKLPRSDFLDRLNNAKITVFFPLKKEGFYLPALEGMMLDTLVICPDCVGNKSFCLPGYNCLQPEFTLESMIENTVSALEMSEITRKYLGENAYKTALRHQLANERAKFLNILDHIDHIW